MVSIKNVAFGLLFVVIGVGIAGFGAYTGYVQVNDVTSQVQTVEGTVLSSSITDQTEVDEGETEVEFYPRVEYRYAVDGRQFTGERIYSQLERNQEEGELAGKESDNRNKARRIAGRFPADSQVTVYYFPDDPTRSFLIEPSVDWVMVGITGVFGLVFALAGVGAMFSDD